MISTIIIAFISFISTNIDDIFILMIFFSEISDAMKTHHIIIGQYLGIGALVIISIIGALGVSVVPYEYIGILGFVPIYLGVKAYVDYRKKSRVKEDIAHQESKGIGNNKFEEVTDTEIRELKTYSRGFINSAVIKVFSVTFANGGDNIGIYIPLFTRMDLVGIIVTVVIFMFMVAIWCFVALKLSKHPLVRKFIEKYRHIFVPIVFIMLGIFILIDSKTLAFIYKKIF
ncbi:cadmium resistance transporter family protein [Clostridium argentinense CDC 2741]|uniref:Cadmium resistance transporter family protein n=1 Tax=Clostridium argentinense CDC 2741 TaxID=1418104 RepID=A0A0C1QUI3_9CLOT|nr:cadmium resistance transporter [Clostridium argentinense]ARC84200.1 quaternary ammonium transporter [Clostridium argentinense]KIE44702.1 cadmium resistance transporter family protein [Clostridium argentinense CDC 2741]NFF38151.1 quaternary ammonium transporter [Clostridium argentinense]NFP51184.1 quaternary ammonium transporter [Clostridium argentinense]NFP71457.1 quaternary ammonium transporter [Clostridium argentinense]